MTHAFDIKRGETSVFLKKNNSSSIMIFEISRGGKKLTGWGKNGPAYFFPEERMGRPILSPGKKLTGGNSGLLHR